MKTLVCLWMSLACICSANTASAFNNYKIPAISPSSVVYYLSNPRSATGARYDIKDSAGNAMHNPSVLQMTGQLHKYAAVYHTPYSVGGVGRFRINLAVSNDLLNWTYQRMLVDNADMPKIARVSGASWVVLVHEQWMASGQAQVKFSLFYDFNDLLNGTIRSSWLQPQYSSFGLDGTPSIYEFHLSMTNGYYDVDGQYGFHFWDGKRDVAANTTILHLFNPLGGTAQYPSTAVDYNSLLTSYEVKGNIGQRDTLVTGDARYNVQEGNTGTPAESWGEWRIWLYTFNDSHNYPTGNGTVTPISPATPNGSQSFGNPSISVVDRPSGGGKALVISYFIFNEGAGPGEAGSLLYYYEI